MAKFSDLVGKTIVDFINNNDYEIIIKTSDGNKYKMLHYQDCFESVWVEDISGEIPNILNSPILVAEESTSNDENDYGISQWAFYKIDTAKGGITIRWCGDSNGYYSVDVNFVELN